MAHSKELQRIFKAYGIRVVPVPAIPTGMSIPNSRLGVGCDPPTRMVFVNKKKQEYEGLQKREELVLHELCHVVVQPPRMDIAKVPELAILLPFEHALLTEYLPAHLEKGEDFQYGTDLKVRYKDSYYDHFGDMRKHIEEANPCTEYGQVFGSDPDYQERLKRFRTCYEHPLYLEGVEMCKRLGLLDDKGQVFLGEYPDWSWSNLRAFKKHMEHCRQRTRPNIKKLKAELKAIYFNGLQAGQDLTPLTTSGAPGIVAPSTQQEHQEATP